MKNIEKEPLYICLYGNWYKGSLPNFMPIEDSTAKKVLEDNYEVIKEEFLSRFDLKEEDYNPMYVPNSYEDRNWNVLNFYGYSIKNIKNVKKYPVLDSVLQQIPGMIGAQFSILNPHTQVKAHFSATSGFFRFHLPLIVPAPYPKAGVRVRNEKRGWEEGKVIAISEAIRHYTWNNTDKQRVLLLVDVLRPEYRNKKNYICAASLVLLVMRFFTYKFPKTRNFPRWAIWLIFQTLLIPVYALLFIQNTFGINMGRALWIKKILKKNK